jgi:glycosyltransferase involved in cell wall biosynthesis
MAFAGSNALVGVTDGWAATIRAHPAVSVPVHVVRYGVDHQLFVPSATNVGQAMSKRSGRFTVGFIGSATSDDQSGRKGLDTLELVARRLATKEPKSHILFLGIGWDGQVEKLRAKGISCESVGFVPDRQLPAFYARLDAYLVTSRVEGGPCTVLEAMACGVPVVATRVGLVGETIVHGVTGFFADVNDAPALSDALLALAASAEMRAQIGIRARAHVAQALGWATTLEPLRAVYESVIADAGERARKAAPYRNVARMLRIVASADALVWVTALVRRRRAGLCQGVKMLRALTAGLDFRDHIAGIRALMGKVSPLSEL